MFDRLLGTDFGLAIFVRASLDATGFAKDRINDLELIKGKDRDRARDHLQEPVPRYMSEWTIRQQESGWLSTGLRKVCETLRHEIPDVRRVVVRILLEVEGCQLEVELSYIDEIRRFHATLQINGFKVTEINLAQRTD